MLNVYRMPHTAKRGITAGSSAAAWGAGRSASCILCGAWRICHRARSAQGAPRLWACPRGSPSAQRREKGVCGKSQARRALARRAAVHLERVNALALLVGVVHEMHRDRRLQRPGDFSADDTHEDGSEYGEKTTPYSEGRRPPRGRLFLCSDDLFARGRRPSKPCR